MAKAGSVISWAFAVEVLFYDTKDRWMDSRETQCVVRGMYEQQTKRRRRVA